MAYVVIQHLSPTAESALVEILSRHTEMQTLQGAHGDELKANHIYVIPPNTKMGIEKGRLTLAPRPPRGVKFMPIDFFFRCLAQDSVELAIGVILSGSDSDGVEGLRHIKSKGGLTLAQAPDTAKMPEMPRNAIAAGAVDKVLTAAEIATELQRVGRNPLLPVLPEEVAPARIAMRIYHILHEKTAVDFSQYRFGTFSRRLKRRLLLYDQTSLEKYADLLETNEAECSALFNDLLINVTWFFRDSEVFEYLQTNLFPKILERQPPSIPIRIWVPGCATGEEAYSMAIALSEVMRASSKKLPIQIFASDLSASVLQIAREGFYPNGIATDVSTERLARYFKKVTGGYRVIQEIREMCIFAKHDVTRDPPFSRMDLISCRNLLIYFESKLQKRVLNTFAYALNPGSHLLLGTAESVISNDLTFAPADKRVRVYTRKAFSGRPLLETPKLLNSKRILGLKQSASPPVNGFEAVEREADRILIEEYGPAGVIIDEHMQIVRFRGRTGDFLEHSSGEPNLNLYDMARGGLGQEILVLLKRSKRENSPVVKHGVELGPRRRITKATITIHPLGSTDETRYFLVLFIATPPPGKQSEKPAKSRAQSKSAVTTSEELAATREYLQTIISDQEALNEALKSANEEVMSSNEELQSTNEELETAKEELQSTNEELTTVNEELATRNADLTQSSNDLSNLLASVDMPIVMIGNDLRIRRYTPKAETVLNLIPSDVGRPITDIRTKLDIANLDKLISDAVETLAPTELAVSDSSGRKYYLRVRPYRTDANKVDGIVMILVDIPSL